MFRFSLGSFISLEVSVARLSYGVRKMNLAISILIFAFQTTENGQFMTYAKEELIDYLENQ